MALKEVIGAATALGLAASACAAQLDDTRVEVLPAIFPTGVRIMMVEENSSGRIITTAIASRDAIGVFRTATVWSPELSVVIAAGFSRRVGETSPLQPFVCFPALY